MAFVKLFIVLIVLNTCLFNLQSEEVYVKDITAICGKQSADVKIWFKRHPNSNDHYIKCSHSRAIVKRCLVGDDELDKAGLCRKFKLEDLIFNRTKRVVKHTKPYFVVKGSKPKSKNTTINNKPNHG